MLTEERVALSRRRGWPVLGAQWEAVCGSEALVGSRSCKAFFDQRARTMCPRFGVCVRNVQLPPPERVRSLGILTVVRCYVRGEDRIGWMMLTLSNHIGQEMGLGGIDINASSASGEGVTLLTPKMKASHTTTAWTLLGVNM